MASFANSTLTGNQMIDGILGKRYWTDFTITFSFPTQGSQYGSDYTNVGGTNNEPTNGFEAFTAGQASAVRDIFANIETFTNLTFTEVSGGAGTLRFAESNSVNQIDPDVLGYAFEPSTLGVGGDMWLAHNAPDAPTPGTQGYHVLLHEIGHALGLWHSNYETYVNGVLFRPAVPAGYQKADYAVMYSSANDVTFADTDVGHAGYRMLDIAALQHLYGANYSTASGDTTYSFDPNQAVIFQTIWDGGGTDILTFPPFRQIWKST